MDTASGRAIYTDPFFYRNLEGDEPSGMVEDIFEVFEAMDRVRRTEDIGGGPETSGEDNLGTLRLVQAGYRSMEEGRAVRPEEMG